MRRLLYYVYHFAKGEYLLRLSLQNSLRGSYICDQILILDYVYVLSIHIATVSCGVCFARAAAHPQAYEMRPSRVVFTPIVISPSRGGRNLSALLARHHQQLSGPAPHRNSVKSLMQRRLSSDTNPSPSSDELFFSPSPLSPLPPGSASPVQTTGPVLDARLTLPPLPRRASLMRAGGLR